MNIPHSRSLSPSPLTGPAGWSWTTLLLAVCFMGICPSAFAVIYYSQGSLAPNLTSSWNSNPGGGGSSPTDFTSAADTFVVQAAHTMATTAAWTVSGGLQISSGGVLQVIATGGASFGSLNNSGTLSLSTGTVNRTLTLAGNLVNNGTINGSTGGSTPGNQIVFSANAAWTGSADISNGKIGITVNPGVALDISGLSTALKFRATGTMVSTINGALITGTQVINGNGNASHTFNLNAGATLDTANTGGVNGTFTWAGTLNLNSGANYTFSGSAAQVTGSQMPATVNGLTINNPTGVTLSAATTVNGTLALTAGALTTSGANKPTIAAAGTVTGTGHVNGPLARVHAATGAKAYRVGKGGNVRTVTLDYTALTGTSTVTVEQFESAMGGTLPANTAQFNDRYWAVSESGGSGLVFDLSLDGTGFSPAGTAVMLREGTPAASYSTTFAAPDYTATGISTTGNFTLGDLTAGLDQLAFTTSAHTLTAGVTSGTITVQLQDSGGSPKNAAADLVVSLSSSSGQGTFRDVADTTTITEVAIAAGNHSASFRYRDTTAPATPLLTVSAPSVAAANQAQTVNVGPAAQLVFVTQPTDGNVNYPLTPVAVRIRDAYGNNVPQSGTAITLTLNNAGPATLTGTNPQNSDGTGTATFDDLAVTATGAGLSLDASSPGLPPATSSNFTISRRQIVKARTPTPMDQTASWTGGVVPGVNDIAVINNSSVGVSPNHRTDFGASTSWHGLIVSNWSANTGYAISNTANATLTLGPGGLVGTDVNHSFTLSNHIALAGAQTWQWGDASSSSGTLGINGNFNNNGHLLTLGGRQLVSVAGVISGSGGLTWTGDSRITLAAANTYTGPTTVSGGILRVDGSLASGSAVTVSGGTLQGSGTVGGPVDIQVGGTLAPGSGGIGTLTANHTVTLAGTTALEINKAGLTLTSDLVTGITTLNCGGAVTVTATGDALTAGDEFTVFSAASFTGSFAGIAPAPGAGLAWDTNQLATQGRLLVHHRPVAGPNVASVARGGSAVFSAAKLLANDSDADGDPLTIVAVTAASGTATLAGQNINYTAPGSGSSDTITYTLSDGRGGETNGIVTVTLTSPDAPSLNIVSAPVLENNEFKVGFAGIPNQIYAVEDSTNSPAGPWSFLTNLTAGANGLFNLVVTNDPPAVQRYFRTTTP